MRNTVLILSGILYATICLAADPAYYQKKDTWQKTLFASREALLADEAQQQARTPASKIDPELKWSPWHHIGAFQGQKNALLEVFEPEKEIELNKTYGKLRWTQHAEWADGETHDLTTGGNTATYLYRTVTVTKRTIVTAYFGSDDGMAFWLNGKRLILNDVPRGVSANADQAKLELAPGENKLLFKIHNQGGGCGFYFSTQPTPRGANPKRDHNRKQLWQLVQRDFPDAPSRQQMSLEQQDNLWSADWPAGNFAAMAGRYAAATRGQSAARARDLAKGVKDAAGLAAVRDLYYRARAQEEVAARAGRLNAQGLRLAINDLMQTFGDKYPKGRDFLARVDALEKAILDAQANDPEKLPDAITKFESLRAEALLGNPLIDFDKLLLVKRGAGQLGLPQNWQGNCAVPRGNYDNEITVLSPVKPGGKLATLYRPASGEFVGDVDLHFDADKMLFSMPGANKRWQIFELKADGTGLRQVTAGEEPDVDNYDPCYLPDGKIIYGSTACFHGVPCVGGGNTVANLFRMDADGKNARQLCFDQDHNWCPTVTNDGRVMYTRWEYSDTAHYFTRILFRMNPDGTGQTEYYGSNSYWPNSIFYARPIPNHPTKLIAVISGHHGVPRMGELVLFDPGKSARDAGGAVQRIPGYGKPVEPKVQDTLVNESWPKFLHPYPLSEKHFLVSCQPTASSHWGLYLVDIFDNMTLIMEQPGYALFEPVPLRKTARPPVIPDRVNLASREASVYIADVYAGEGLKGVPRGTVKSLRVYEPHYAYPHMGGHINIGVDGPWDARRIHGTVPVETDGSVSFKVPANTPLAVQPLDADGRAVQVMRSWFTAMPGETLSCVGCHEQQNANPPAKDALAFRRAPSDIKPWYGPARGFSFKREVQPVLDQYCVGCHNEKPRPDGKTLADFTAKPTPGWRNFTPSYLALHPFVRRPGPESDYHIQVPLEFHASTSELVQMLKKGHYNVTLDAEAWDRLYTWIDLNVPDHGTWGEHRKVASNFHQRRLEMRTKYANRPEDPEAIPQVAAEKKTFMQPAPMPARKQQEMAVAGWPFDAAEAKKRQASAGLPSELKIDLSDKLAIKLVLVPAGSFIMGDASGEADESPRAIVKVARPFYMAVTETTNEQYAPFNPRHDSRYISVLNKDQSTPGEVANRPLQPVIRISWEEAMAYCQWLSQRTGKTFTLPTEAQWEYACRAGSTTAMSYGGIDTDFGKLANLADSRVNNLARGDSPKWIPSVATVNDGAIITDHVGRYAPNAWGLFDMHGNAAEWTRTTYKAYPYDGNDGRDAASHAGDKVVRGGSFYDRPQRARSASRQAYQPWQKIYNVGFRVICETP